MFLPQMLWCLWFPVVVSLSLSVTRHSVCASEQLRVPSVIPSMLTTKPPFCESEGGMSDALWHRLASSLLSKTPTWFNFSSPAFLAPGIMAPTPHWHPPWSITIEPNLKSPTQSNTELSAKISHPNKTNTCSPRQDLKDEITTNDASLLVASPIFLPESADPHDDPRNRLFPFHTLRYRVFPSHTLFFTYRCRTNYLSTVLLPTDNDNHADTQTLFFQLHHLFSFSTVAIPTNCYSNSLYLVKKPFLLSPNPLSMSRRTPPNTKPDGGRRPKKPTTASHHPRSSRDEPKLSQTRFTPVRQGGGQQHTTAPIGSLSDPLEALRIQSTTGTQYVLPATLHEALWIRSPYRQTSLTGCAQAVILQGFKHLQSPTANAEAMPMIADFLKEGGISLDPTDLTADGPVIRALRSFDGTNGAACGYIGSTNEGLSLVCKLLRPVPSLEATVATPQLILRSVDLAVAVQKNSMHKRTTNITAKFSLTAIPLSHRRDLLCENIDTAHTLDPNWHLLFMVGVLHKDLNHLRGSLMQDVDLLIDNLLTPEESQYFTENSLITPLTVHCHTSDNQDDPDFPRTHGFAIHQFTVLDNPLHMQVRTRILTALFQNPKQYTAMGNFHGIRPILFQSSDPKMNQQVDTSCVPPEVRAPYFWTISFHNLPPALDSHTIYLILTYGFGFAASDILSVSTHQDQLHKTDVPVLTRFQACTTLLLASADVLRTLISYQAPIIDAFVLLAPATTTPNRTTTPPSSSSSSSSSPAPPVTWYSPHFPSAHNDRPLEIDGPFRRLSKLQLNCADLNRLRADRRPATNEPTPAMWSATVDQPTVFSSPTPPTFSFSPSPTHPTVRQSQYPSPIPYNWTTNSTVHTPTVPDTRLSSPKRLRSPNGAPRHIPPTYTPDTDHTTVPVTSTADPVAVHAAALTALHTAATQDTTGVLVHHILNWALEVINQAALRQLPIRDETHEHFFVTPSHPFNIPLDLPDFQSVEDRMDQTPAQTDSD